MADGSMMIERPQEKAMPARLKVRLATPEEVDDVMRLALMCCEENQFIQTSPVKVLEQVWAGLKLDRGMVGVIGEPGAIEGGVLLRIGPVWYSNNDVIEEKAVFVHPDFRSAKGGRAARLIEFSKSIADQLGLPLCIGVLSSHRTEAKVRAYRRVIGEPSGAYWVYWSNGIQPADDNKPETIAEKTL